MPRRKNHPITRSAYPLDWPIGWNRTDPSRRERNLRYRISLHATLDLLHTELRRRVDKSIVVISSNVPLRSDGQMHSCGVVTPSDPGVAVYWVENGVERVIACDAWVEPRENVRAIVMALESLRQLERCRATEILNRAFQGFNALPDHTSWWSILGVLPDSNPEEVKQAYRKLCLDAHPDRGGGGGSNERMVSLNLAYEEFQRSIEIPK